MMYSAIKNARLHAAYHVQMELEKVPNKPGKGQVSGRVVRIFRGTPRLRLGDTVEFEVWAARKQHELQDVLIGVAYLEFDALRHARYVEVFLDGEPPNCTVPEAQHKIIESPSDAPAIPSIPAAPVVEGEEGS
jgi:hypothetical protein